MIVAIVNQTVPSGVVAVSELREAVDEATAVADFAAAHGVDPLDYLGVNTGWLEYTPPSDGHRWAYDFDNPGLTEVDHGFNFELSQFKAIRYKQIDARTNELILQGFTYNGVTLSLSERAQIRIEGTDRARNDAAMVYPITWNSLDDTTAVTLADATEVHAMYLAALATLRSRVDSGSVLKDQIRNAVDKAAVDAVVDNR